MGHSEPSLTWFQSERSIEPPALSIRAVSRLSLMAAFVAAEAFSIYAVFVAHALTPVHVFIVDRLTNHVLVPGSIGNLEEVFNWNGLLPYLLFTLITFTLTWWAVRWAISITTGPSAARPRTVAVLPVSLAVVSD